MSLTSSEGDFVVIAFLMRFDDTVEDDALLALHDHCHVVHEHSIRERLKAS